MKNTLKWSIITGLFLIPFTPLIISSSLLFPFIAGKAIFFKIIVGIVFALYLILVSLDQEYRPKKSWISLAVTVFLAVVFLADVFGINPHKSFWSNFERMEGFFLILHLWMFYVVSSAMFTKKLWQQWMVTSISVSILIAIYGLFQVGGAIDIRQGSDRLDGTLGNAAYLAVYMLLNIGFALYLAVQKKTLQWQRILLGILVLLQLYIIFKTATRGTILGIAAGLFVASIIYIWKAKEDKLGRNIAIGVLALIFVLTGSLYLSKDTNFVKNNNTLNRLAQTLSVKNLLNNPRAKFIWPIAIEGIKDRPILGYGQEGFNYVFNTYYNSKMWTEEAWFDRAHNVFLDWFIAAGVLGFGLYITLYVLAVRFIWKGDFSLREKMVLIGLMIAYAVHNMTVFDNISSYILFFAFLAFLHSQNAKEHVKKIAINVDIRDLVLIPIVVIVTLVLTYYVNIVPIRVGQLTIDGIRQYPGGPLENLKKYKEAMSYNVTGSQEVREQAIQTSEQVINKSKKDISIQQAFFVLSNQAIQDQIAYAPEDARGYLLGGSYLNRIGQVALALPLLQKAHELTPNKQAPLFEIAQNQLNTGKYQEAIVTLKQAFDLDPNFPDARRLYIITLLYAERFDDISDFISKYPPSALDEPLINLFLEKKQAGLIVKIYERFMKDRPNDVQVRGSLAAAYLMNGERALSIKTLEQAIKDFPEFKDQGTKLINDINLGKNPIQK